MTDNFDPFPDLGEFTTADRCGTPECSGGADWHVIWRPEVQASHSVVCADHFMTIRERAVYAFSHVTGPSCGQPASEFCPTHNTCHGVIVVTAAASDPDKQATP